jgi:hypothetical protein
VGVALLLALAPGHATAKGDAERPGVPPASASACPATHPVKGNFTATTGELCIYHVPGGRFYDKAKPERCYVSGDQARTDGCRPAKR